MNKSFRHIEDFLEDDSFRNWVLSQGNVRSLFWETWLKNHPGQADLLYEAKEILLALQEENEEEEGWQEEDEIRILHAINSAIDFPEQKPSYSKVREHYATKRNQFIWLKVSVILLVMVVSAVIVGSSGVFSENTSGTTEPTAWVTREALPGEKKKVSLPDGSTVILNSASTLRYQADFGLHHRDIVLTGESYFEVAKDSLLPFRVHGGDLMTEAVGTAFNVRAFPDEQTTVKLIEGKVMVEFQHKESREADKLLLTPGEKALASADSFTKGKFDPQTALLWTEGTLYFDDQPFAQVMKDLERWYGVEIAVEGAKTSSQRVSGEFHRDNLENVLQSISYSFGFDFSINHKQVSIQFKSH